MTTNIGNKAKEVKAWIAQSGPDLQQPYASRALLEISQYILRRWPDLEPSIRLAILNEATA